MQRRLKFAVPEWEISTPGTLPDGSMFDFMRMVEGVASQSRRAHDVFEDFKWWFSGGTAPRSSTESEAKWQVHSLMEAVAANTPVFVVTFVEACEDVGQQGYRVPSIDRINGALRWPNNSGFQIDGDRIVQSRWAPRQDPDPPHAAKPEETDKDFDKNVTDFAPAEKQPPILDSWAPVTQVGTPTVNRRVEAFLCHSSGDKEAVRALYRKLRVDGFQPWLDEEEDLLPGQDWEAEIPKAVKRSDVVIVCLSKTSITKTGYVQKEIKFALDAADERPEGAIYLIPTLLKDCKVPDRLARWHWVRLYEPRGYERLVASLKSCVTGNAVP